MVAVPEFVSLLLLLVLTGQFSLSLALCLLGGRLLGQPGGTPGQGRRHLLADLLFLDGCLNHGGPFLVAPMLHRVVIVVGLADPPLISEGGIKDAFAIAVEGIPVESGLDYPRRPAPVICHRRKLVLPGLIFPADDDVDMDSRPDRTIIILAVFVNGVEIEKILMRLDPFFIEPFGVTVHHPVDHDAEGFHLFLPRAAQLGSFFSGGIQNKGKEFGVFDMQSRLVRVNGRDDCLHGYLLPVRVKEGDTFFTLPMLLLPTVLVIQVIGISGTAAGIGTASDAMALEFGVHRTG